MKNKILKYIIFILLIIIFIIIVLHSIFGLSISYLTPKEIKESRKLKENLVQNITINGIDAIYDMNDKIYYYSINKEKENKNYILKINLENGYKYKIVDEDLNIVKVRYDKPFKIIIYNKKEYCEIKLQLTNLSLVNIKTNNDIDINEKEGIFAYINQAKSKKIFTNNIKIKLRGATTQVYPKKPYRINFYNKDYTNEKKISFSNFYIGDSLILDALYRDTSKIRNILSTDLWNEISSDFTTNSIYSEFVEVFINNEYKGIYVLIEPINRTNLSLNKTNREDSSFIIKSSLGNFEMKYPNNKDYETKVINKTKRIVSKYVENGVNSTYNVIKDTFDINNYVDLLIFNFFTNNLDSNLIQNVYYYNNSLNDKVLFIQPWDMEWTFGKIMGFRDRTADIFDCPIYHKNAKEINNLIITRYWELRKNILTKEYFDNKLNKYIEEIGNGADIRDSKLWSGKNIKEEIEIIRKWIYERIEYADNYVKELENE